MFNITRLSMLSVSFAILTILLLSESVYAQRGGFRIGNSNDKNQNKGKADDKNINGNSSSQFSGRRSDGTNDHKNNSNNSNNNNSSNNDKKQSNQQKVEQLLQGGGNNPNNNQPFNKNQQGQQFKKGGGQGQNNPNNQPFQQFGGNSNENDGPSNKNWQQYQWRGSNNIQKWAKHHNSGPQPFTSKWYDEHSNAWHYHHPHSDVWVVATIPGVYSWLGWGDYPRNGNIVYDNHPFDPSIYGDWYPVGVYSLITGPYDSGTRIFQISFDRQGNVAGTYYDMVSDSTRQITGRVRRSTQQVDWSVDTNGALTFRTSVDQLFQPQGIVSVAMPGGEQQWQLVRMQNANDQ